MKRGDLVMAKQTLKLGSTVQVTEGSCYTVNSVSGTGRYLLILGDDNEGHDFLADLFTKISD